MFRLSMTGVSIDAAEVGRRRSIDATHHAGEEVWTAEGTNTQTFPEEDCPTWPDTMCSIASGSSNSDTASTCSSASEKVDAEDPEEFSIPRRSTRGTRGLEEKSMQWKIVHLPVFQDWARKSVFLQKALPVPEALEEILQNGASLPECEARLPQSKRKLKRSSSAPMERLLSAEPLVGQKDSEGVLRSFVRFGQRLKVEDKMRSALSEMTVTNSIEMTVAQETKDEAVLKRANSGVLKLLVQNLITRTRMRTASDDMDMDDHYSRSKITAEANKFDRSYARMRNTIEERISFIPLQRAHTSCLGERPFRH